MTTPKDFVARLRKYAEAADGRFSERPLDFDYQEFVRDAREAAALFEGLEQLAEQWEARGNAPAASFPNTIALGCLLNCADELRKRLRGSRAPRRSKG